MERPSLYDFAGGAPAMYALARATHERCLADPVLEHPFSHDNLDPDHVQHLADYWAEVLGGPATYSGSRGGHSYVLRIHAHQGMQADLGDRFVAAFVGGMDDAGLPADPEFRAAMRAYMEWAAAEVMSYDPPETAVPTGAPTPHWTWTGRVPAQ